MPNTKFPNWFFHQPNLFISLKQDLKSGSGSHHHHQQLPLLRDLRSTSFSLKPWLHYFLYLLMIFNCCSSTFNWGKVTYVLQALLLSSSHLIIASFFKLNLISFFSTSYTNIFLLDSKILYGGLKSSLLSMPWRCLHINRVSQWLILPLESKNKKQRHSRLWPQWRRIFL